MRGLLLLALLAAAACGPSPASRPSASAGPERAFHIERQNAPGLLASGETRLVSLTLANRGSLPWPASGPGAVSLSYHWDADGRRASGDRIALPNDVAAGALVDVIARVTAPPTPGDYVLSWDLGDGGGTFESDRADARLTVQVRVPEARVEWADAQAPGSMTADVRDAATVSVRNAGNVAWPARGAGSVALAYHWRDRNGRIVIWDGDRTPLQDALLPGESVEATLRVLPPPAVGWYVLEVDAVREGTSWFGGGPRLAVTVCDPSYGVAFSSLKAPQRVAIGEKFDLSFEIKNVGAAPWANGQRRTAIAYHVLDGSGRLVVWDGPRTELAKTVGPGDRVEVHPTVLAPHEAGRYTYQFDLVREGVAWFGKWNPSLQFTLDVAPLDFHAHFASVSAGTVMATGLTYRVRASVLNTDALAWPSRGFSPVRLAYHWLDGNGKTVLWDGERAELDRDVNPGDIVDLSLALTAPERPGRYSLVLDMVQEGISWFFLHGTIPAKIAVDVVRPTFAATFTGSSVPERVTAGGIASARVTVRNDSPFPWPIDGEHPVHLAHHWRTTEGQLVAWDGFRSELPRELAPGESADVQVWFYVPVTPGLYVLELDAVQEDVAWFGERGSTPLRKPIAVVP